MLVIDLLDAQGQPDRLRLPLYDVLIGDAEAVWALLIGDLRLPRCRLCGCGGVYRRWGRMDWYRVARLRTLAEIPASKLVEVLDLPCQSISLRDHRHVPHYAQGSTPSATSAGMRCGTRQTGLTVVVQEALRA